MEAFPVISLKSIEIKLFQIECHPRLSIICLRVQYFCSVVGGIENWEKSSFNGQGK